jgi:O-antigen/teichoic acid export membrane protein
MASQDPTLRRSLARRTLAGARASTGVRASGVLLGSAAVTLAGSYLFNLICIRWLGARDYGDVAALTTIATMVLLPLVGVQAALAREVATFNAEKNDAAISSLLTVTIRRALLVGVPALLLLLAISPVLANALKIDATASAVAAVILVCAAAPIPVLQGFLQGLERYALMAAGLVANGFGRALLVMPILLAGFGVWGALTAGTIAAVAAVAITLVGLRDVWRQPSGAKIDLDLKGFKLVIFGLFAFTVLMNADVLAAKAFLPEDDAGRYASASLVGKLAALLPVGVIAPVLLPRATARLHRGENAHALVARSLLATASFGALLTLVLIAVPQSLVEWGFGEQFGDARDLLAPCAAVMTLCGLLNVNLTFAFALRDHWLIALLGLAVLVEAALFGVLHGSGYQILAATAIAALTVIVPHELRSPASMWRLSKLAGAARGRPLRP